MQVTGLTLEGEKVDARAAARGTTYLCPECATGLRVRKGLYRRPHFYHIAQTRPCQLGGKTEQHIQTQLFLQKRLQGAELEVIFPVIGRIADLVWEKEKLIFEVQCSPISAEEVLQRNSDYGSVGYQVVWIFHEKKFNQRRLSEAEIAILRSPHYFTDMDSRGVGGIYDQPAEVRQGVRLKRLAQLEVDPARVYRTVSPQAPLLFVERARWPVFFEGDYLSRMQKGEKLGWKRVDPPRKRGLFRRCFLDPYSIVLDYFLEKACNKF